ncbi:hypothetical protein BC749_10348 [Flavobacterium araucananum]|uniref:DUF6734 domain-containing protein n=1 Tax=Flavobacterium araucananum TaxID=946678 RepID=A0A227PIC7_9FLAO|nr:DUF6734 family protein [Flavobacterium araucananum]OXG09134.1 hypothetical protein B0A64_03830 [Flavobacterium araucananum]PWJ99670.1 hypothetical protein BC749_10348 [Flavobacterium araucananum]
MKIVQSLWIKPSLKKENVNVSDRNKGGWFDKKYNYMSWALSCLQFKKYYDKVELVTDALGYDLLINKLELPYTKVDVSLDVLNDYHPDLWALGKIYAYSIQDEPFIHADGDIFIYKKFEESFEKSALISQNLEKGFDYYDQVFTSIKENFDYVPDYLYESQSKNNQIIAVNAGLLGGSSLDFMKEYTAEAFRFVDNNTANLDKINIGMFNTVFEQFLFHSIAEKKEIDVSYYLSNVNHVFDGLADFTALPNKGAYIHTVGIYKRVKYICDLLAHRLLTDYPEYYYKIMTLIRTNQI